MKIGLMGGSFDPVHNGHLVAAKNAVKQHGLDRLIMLPADHSPSKSPDQVTAAHHRIAMLHIAIEGEPQMEVSDFEIAQGGASYTIATVRHFRAQFAHDELFWVMGSDKVPSLDRWRSIEELVQMMEFISIERPGAVSPPQPATHGLTLHRCVGNSPDISSTAIRNHLKQGLSVVDFLPSQIIAYIGQSKLYQ